MINRGLKNLTWFVMVKNTWEGPSFEDYYVEVSSILEF